MTATASGADILAGTLFTSLTAGVDFTIPEINISGAIFNQPDASGPLYSAITPVAITDLTTGMIDGDGVFDKIMTSLTAHLKIEYEQNRISGAEYTKAYIGIVSAALQTAQQFLLSKDQAYWQSLLVQAQARSAEIETTKARIELETARVNFARYQFEAATVKVNYALTKLKLSTEDVTYNNMVLQGANLAQQTANLLLTGEGIDFTNTFILPQQEKLLKEQVEVQNAQTANNRTGGAVVTGLIGKQKDLYTQQIDSYKRDSETKAVKIWSDAYVTQMTVLDGVTAPNQFDRDNINEMLTKLRVRLDMTTS